MIKNLFFSLSEEFVINYIQSIEKLIDIQSKKQEIPDRVDSCKLGAMKAQLPLKGTVAASDAFFPFPDGVEEIAKAGATAIIQPGGSVRDQEVIEAADRLGLAMIFTGVRHFRH